MLLRRLPLLAPRWARSLSSTVSRSISLESPTYPGLFYHSHPSLPHTYALSFLPAPAPSLEFSPSTIGILKNTDRSAEGGVPPNLLPRNFEDNKDFVELLHEVLREAVELDMGIGTMAKIRREGYIHIADERNPADPNRVPDPSDIIASVLIQNSKVLSSAYEISRTHRLVTMDGMMRLNQSLQDKLLQGLERCREAEIEMHAE